MGHKEGGIKTGFMSNNFGKYGIKWDQSFFSVRLPRVFKILMQNVSLLEGFFGKTPSRFNGKIPFNETSQGIWVYRTHLGNNDIFSYTEVLALLAESGKLRETVEWWFWGEGIEKGMGCGI